MLVDQIYHKFKTSTLSCLVKRTCCIIITIIAHRALLLKRKMVNGKGSPSIESIRVWETPSW